MDFYKNVLRLFRSPDLHSRLQNLKLVEREEVVSFQWVGPHFLAFLKYATNLSDYGDSIRPSDTIGLLQRETLRSEADIYLLKVKFYLAYYAVSFLSNIYFLDYLFSFLRKRRGDSSSIWNQTERESVFRDYNRFNDLSKRLVYSSSVWNRWIQTRRESSLRLRYDIFNDLLKRLDDSASDCILYGETEHYENFLEIILSFMPKIREFFTYQHKFTRHARKKTELGARFINFLLKTIGELLSYGTDSSVLVSNQVKILVKELQFLLTFHLDTMRCLDAENRNVFPRIGFVKDKELIYNIFTEIEVVSNGVGLFLHSFFFTTDRVTATNMDLAINVLLERIEIVKVKIHDYCIAVSMKLNCGIGSLKVAETPSEVSSSQDKSIPMKGFEDLATQIKNHLLRGTNNRQIISIVGMPGLGKTTLAKKLYNDSQVRSRYDVISWCVVSQTYKKRKLLIDILRSTSYRNIGNISEMDDQDLALCLYNSLRGRRYLIALDDLWDEETWDDLEKLFPEDTNGSRVLFTSRQKNVASRISHVIFEPPRLSQSESWDLLKKQVFKKECCPQELQSIGKEIAEKCDGLPLSIVAIAGVLSNMEKKESLWHQVASSLSSYISQKADDYVPKLKLSYMHLPDHLKPCFLYLSAFQEDEEISVEMLLLLWIAEGLVEKKEHKSLEDVAEEYLIELIDRSLLQVAKKRADNGVKECTLHDLVLEMCWKIAEEEKFLFQHQFLLSKHRNRLCMDQSRDPSVVLSILLNPEKIRILDAEDDYDLMGIKIMPDLRYLRIPSLVSSVVKLQKLESLTVESITKIPAFLLNLPKLRHLCVGDVYSPGVFDKDCDSSLINSLQTLCYVIMKVPAHEKILRRSPNLRKLSYSSQRSFIPDLDFLSRLESLTVFFETEFRGDYSVVNFPKNIKYLSIYGMLLPWKKMSLIGTLPNLEILKLKSGAFEGKIWNTNDDEFQKLKFLKLSGSHLEQWNSSNDHFPVLEQLVLRFCQKLEMIPSDFSNIPTLQKINLDYCGKDAISSALQIFDEQRDNGNEEFQVLVSTE